MEVTDSEIIQKYFNINPVGMPEITIAEVKKKLADPNAYPIDGVPFTLDGLAEKYKKYIDWHRKKFGNEEKYIKTDDKLASPADFVSLNRFYNQYGNAKGKREYYLFGDASENELREKLRAFLSKYGVELDTPKKSLHAAISSNHDAGKQETFQIEDSPY
jgi:hypothetical protein